MTETSNFKNGEKSYPRTERILTEAGVLDIGWSVERRNDRYLFSFPSAAHGGGEICYEICASDFEAVRNKIIGFSELVGKYHRVPKVP